MNGTSEERSATGVARVWSGRRRSSRPRRRRSRGRKARRCDGSLSARRAVFRSALLPAPTSYFLLPTSYFVLPNLLSQREHVAAIVDLPAGLNLRIEFNRLVAVRDDLDVIRPFLEPQSLGGAVEV